MRRRARCETDDGVSSTRGWQTGNGAGWFADFAAGAPASGSAGAARRPGYGRARPRTRPSRRCATGCSSDYLPVRGRARRTALGRSAIGPAPSAGTERVWILPRPTTGAGRSTGRSWPRCGPRRSRSCRARHRRRPCSYLDSHSEVIDGVDAVRDRLQQLMDDAMSQPGRDALRPRGSDQGGGGQDRAAGQRGRAVLHRAVAGLLPAGPDLAADAGQDHVPDVGAHQYLVPRGRARPSPAARAVAVPGRAAVAVPDGRRRRERLPERAGRCTPSG